MDIAARVKHPEERVGDTLIGKYKLDELLGIGAMAAVFSATHRNGKRVAIKLLHQHLADEPVIIKRFLREGYAANKVGHPAVVSALDDNETEDGCPFLVLDLLEGRPLDDVLREKGPMEPTRVLEIADQLLDALSAAHEKGVIHRDLKPENLLLASDGTVRMLDFGIARVDEEQQQQDPRLTVPGRAMGTPGFMAPEQAQGLWEQVDARTDLWSVGATMFALLTGREVHIATKAHELLIAAMTRPVQPLREVGPHIPENVCAIVDRALAFDPGKRFPSATVMQEWVRDAVPEAPLVSVPDAIPSGPSSMSPSSLSPTSLAPPSHTSLDSQQSFKVEPKRRGGFGRVVTTFILSAAACTALHVYYVKSKGLPVVPSVVVDAVKVKPLSAGLPTEAADWVDEQTIDLDAVVLEDGSVSPKAEPLPDEEQTGDEEPAVDEEAESKTDSSGANGQADI